METRAFARNRQQSVGIDRRHGGADDLETGVRVACVQENLQVTAETKGGLRIAERGRFSKNENAAGGRCLLRLHDDRHRAAGDFRWKESKAELVVLHNDGPALNFPSCGKSWLDSQIPPGGAPVRVRRRKGLGPGWLRQIGKAISGDGSGRASWMQLRWSAGEVRAGSSVDSSASSSIQSNTRHPRKNKKWETPVRGP